MLCQILTQGRVVPHHEARRRQRHRASGSPLRFIPIKRHVRPALVAIFAVCAGLISLSTLTAQTQQAGPPKPSFSGKVVAVADGDTLTPQILFHPFAPYCFVAKVLIGQTGSPGAARMHPQCSRIVWRSRRTPIFLRAFPECLTAKSVRSRRLAAKHSG